jgi:hypothetical protein
LPKPSSSTPRRTRLRQAASTFPGRLIQLVRDLDEVWLAPALKRSDNTLDLDLRIFLRTAVVIFCTTPIYHTSARGHAFRWPEALRIGFVALAAALVWFSMWGAYRGRQRDRRRRLADRWLADL